jgi:hypothetical protein
VAFSNALYSTSVLDLETIACFLALQAIRLAPKNTAKPSVDRRSFGHPAQSASANALTTVETDLMNCSPSFSVRLTYLRILLTASQCASLVSVKIDRPCLQKMTSSAESELSTKVPPQHSCNELNLADQAVLLCSPTAYQNDSMVYSQIYNCSCSPASTTQMHIVLMSE